MKIQKGSEGFPVSKEFGGTRKGVVATRVTFHHGSITFVTYLWPYRTADGPAGVHQKQNII